MQHTFVDYRITTEGVTFSAVCSCGWTSLPMGSIPEAEVAFARHAEGTDTKGMKEQILAEYPDAQVIRYSDGQEQIVLAGVDRSDLGRVVRYSDGTPETTINL